MSNTASGSLSVSVPYCPNTSRLIAPTTPAQTAKHLAMTGSSPGKPNSWRSRSKSDDIGCGTGRLVSMMSPVAMPAATASNKRADHPRPGPDRPLGRCVIAGHRAAVQQRPAGRVGGGPTAGGMRDRDDVVAPHVGHCVAGAIDLVGEVGVGVDEQQRQQLVAAGHIPIDRRRHHAEVAGDGTQRQPGRAVFHQMAPAELDDLRLDPFARVAPLAHRAILTQKRSLLLYFRRRCGTVISTESTAL